MSKTLIKPMIHLNGTSREALYHEYGVTIGKIRDAIEAMSNITVHGRDHYVQDPPGEGGVSLRKMMGEHMDRAEKLGDVMRELIEIQDHIYNSGRPS